MSESRVLCDVSATKGNITPGTLLGKGTRVKKEKKLGREMDRISREIPEPQSDRDFGALIGLDIDDIERCFQRFDFRPPTEDDMAELMMRHEEEARMGTQANNFLSVSAQNDHLKRSM